MQPERSLLAGAAAVAVLALVGALVLPGALAAPSEEVRRPGPVRIAEVAVQPGEVSGGTAELALQAQVDHRGNPAPNVTVRFRAVDAESGFVATEQTVSLGTLDDDGWQAVNATLSVAREGGYVVEATVFQDDRPVDSVRKRLSGLGALTPEYARTTIGFSDAGSLPTVGVSVVESGDGRTTLEIASRLTNEGDDASDDLQLVVIMTQAESNLEADTTSVDVGTIRPGRTTAVDAEVQVPSDYNYYVHVALYKDGVLVDSARGVANLDPTETISADVTEKEVEFNVSDFERDRRRDDSRGAYGTATPVSTPGLGVGAAMLALLAAVALLRREVTP